MTTYRLTIQDDPEPDYSWLDQPEFADEDKSDHELAEFILERNEGDCPRCKGSGVVDPSVTTRRRVSVGIRCDLCHGEGDTWQTVAVLCGCDYLLSTGGHPDVRFEFATPLAPDDLSAYDPFTRSTLAEMLSEAGETWDPA